MMNRHSVFPALALLACTAVSGCVAGTGITPRTLAQDEREVMLAVIQSLETNEDGEAEEEQAPDLVLVLEWLTTEVEYPEDIFPDAGMLKEAEVRFPLEVFPDVMRRSASPVPLWRLIGDSTRVRWLTPAQRDSVLSTRGPGVDAGLRRLERLHPGSGGFTSLSRPEFDEPRTHAAVVYDDWCGPLCGSSGVMLLERRQGRWRVIDRMGTIAY